MAVEPSSGRDNGVHGSSRIDEGTKKKTSWLPWLLLALLLLALLFALSRCNRDEPQREAAPVDVNEQATATPDASGETAAAGTAAAAGAASGDILQDLRTYLGSNETAGRRFTFDGINFATGSAELPAQAQSTITGLSSLLQENANARIRIEGYADARGGDAANRDLGARRAQAVKTALTGTGIKGDRIETGTGGENNPVDTNATASGRLDNRRTDVVVTAK